MKFTALPAFTVIFIAISTLWACGGHKHEVTETLKQAYEIQQSGLKTLVVMEEKLKEINPENADIIKSRMDALVQNMIEIEGMDHDHTNCSHGHKKSNVKISDDEMLKVQQEWQDSIVALKRYFKSQMTN